MAAATSEEQLAEEIQKRAEELESDEEDANELCLRMGPFDIIESHRIVKRYKLIRKGGNFVLPFLKMSGRILNIEKTRLMTKVTLFCTSLPMFINVDTELQPLTKTDRVLVLLNLKHFDSRIGDVITVIGHIRIKKEKFSNSIQYMIACDVEEMAHPEGDVRSITKGGWPYYHRTSTLRRLNNVETKPDCVKLKKFQEWDWSCPDRFERSKLIDITIDVTDEKQPLGSEDEI